MAIASYNGGTAVLKDAASTAGGQHAQWAQIAQNINEQTIARHYTGALWQDVTKRQEKVKEITGYVDKILGYYKDYGGSVDLAMLGSIGTYELTTTFSVSENFSLRPMKDAVTFVPQLAQVHDAPQKTVDAMLAEARKYIGCMACALVCPDAVIEVFRPQYLG